MSTRKACLGAGALGVILALAAGWPALLAQDPGAPTVVQETPAAAPGGPPQPDKSGSSKPPPGADAKSPEKQPPQGPDKPGKPGESPAGKETKPKDEKKPDDAPKPVARPEKPADPPDPDELKVRRPDESGMISFSFRGQPWPAVLDWLADVSGMNLDWQELPGDYLNLTTPHPYTAAEARDVINRHLLARGYTILQHDESLSVVKIDKLNPALVPRVAPEDLATRSPNEFVKVSFTLDWLLAEETAKELEPMLSPNGKLTPLKSTNRIEAMDAVVNLREVHGLLTEEQSAGSQERLVREFQLRYARAAEVREQLMEMVGAGAKSSTTKGMTPQQLAQQKAMMEAQRRSSGGSSSSSSKKKPPTPPAPKVIISIVANERKNSILAHAPPDKMAVIAAAVKLLDAPTGGVESLQTLTSRTQVYRLAAIDPKQLVEALEEMGGLDPTTRLHVDGKNRSIIASASLADHLIIHSLVEKLDSSGRRFEVIQLRRLNADEVAGTVEMMMGAAEKEKEPSRDYFFGYSSRRGQREDQGDRFRVSASIEQNQLLLWCNNIEHQEVENLLVKLGEIPAHGSNPNKVRVIEAVSEKERGELLERLRRLWPSLGENHVPRHCSPRSDRAVDRSDGVAAQGLRSVSLGARTRVLGGAESGGFLQRGKGGQQQQQLRLLVLWLSSAVRQEGYDSQAFEAATAEIHQRRRHEHDSGDWRGPFSTEDHRGVN